MIECRPSRRESLGMGSADTRSGKCRDRQFQTNQSSSLAAALSHAPSARDALQELDHHLGEHFRGMRTRQCAFLFANRRPARFNNHDFSHGFPPLRRAEARSRIYSIDEFPRLVQI